ncbi:LOW QUALITY PROTEIN: hypothetical protein HID58_085078 [Brassica napus]|uniref:Uncharacterized protein n=1 Tax=Brassica napus TaxID=3708 RepID=A0ABQ7XLJ9_BRANA|nr:LOW QUALITY PROTEIN: hypothetical protein HID58_085078 [Brassica napus]
MAILLAISETIGLLLLRSVIFFFDRSSSSSHFARMKALFVLSLPVQIFTARSSSSSHRSGLKPLDSIIFFFSPLNPKPLDSIMDLDRSKTKSPEELTSIGYGLIFSSLSYKDSVFDLGRGHIGITMKASQFISWINKQASGVTLLFHCGEEMVTSRCLLKSLSQKRVQHQQSIQVRTQSSISQLARGETEKTCDTRSQDKSLYLVT